MAPPKGSRLTDEQRARITAAIRRRWSDPAFKARMAETMRGRVNMMPSGATLAARLDHYSIPEPNSGCFLWLGPTDECGYGLLRWQGKTHRAHRLAWMARNGEIAPNLHACHHCDVPACVNPDHLFLGTNADNNADKMAKGRHRCNPLLGEAAPAAKLTANQILEIRADNRRQRIIAREYGVDQSRISRVKALVDWRHL